MKLFEKKKEKNGRRTFYLFGKKILSYKKSTNIFSNAQYKKYIENLNNNDKTNFVTFKKYDKLNNQNIKPIAFYLPQFHQFKENN